MAYVPYFNPALLEVARTIIRNPESRPGEIAFAKGVLDEAARIEKLGPWNGETGDRAPAPATNHTGTGNNFSDGPPPVPKGKGKIPEFLGGAELEKLNQGMHVRRAVTSQFERLPTGELVCHNVGPTRAREMRDGARGFRK